MMTATRKTWEEIPDIELGKIPEDTAYPDRSAIIAKRFLKAGYDASDDGDLECHVTDAIADIRHLCDALGFDFFALYDSAYDHYRAEINENEEAE